MPHVNSMTSATTFDVRSAVTASSMKMNGITTGKVEPNTSNATPPAASQSFPVSSGSGGVGEFRELRVEPVEVAVVERLRHERRKCVGDRRTRRFGRSCSDRAEGAGAVGTADQAHGHEHHPIDEAPRGVASDGGEDQRVDLGLVRRPGAERAREREHHDQAEQHL